MARGINANVVHRWRQLAREGEQGTPAKSSEFVALAIAPQSAGPGQACGVIEIEVRRGATTITVAWPTAAAAECASWMRELLR